MCMSLICQRMTLFRFAYVLLLGTLPSNVWCRCWGLNLCLLSLASQKLRMSAKPKGSADTYNFYNPPKLMDNNCITNTTEAQTKWSQCRCKKSSWVTCTMLTVNLLHSIVCHGKQKEWMVKKKLKNLFYVPMTKACSPPRPDSSLAKASDVAMLGTCPKVARFKCR